MSVKVMRIAYTCPKCGNDLVQTKDMVSMKRGLKCFHCGWISDVIGKEVSFYTVRIPFESVVDWDGPGFVLNNYRHLTATKDTEEWDGEHVNVITSPKDLLDTLKDYIGKEASKISFKEEK